MKRFFGTFNGENIILSGQEFLHAKKVLRLNEGDEVIANINDEYDYHCKIQKFNKNDCVLTILEKTLCPSLPKKNIVLFQMLPKKEYLDNIISKSIELGVNKIVPFTSEYTMIKDIKKERVEMQVMTACKQCERSKLIEVTSPIKLQQIPDQIKGFDLVLFAYENSSTPFDSKLLKDKQNIALIVGNEGGFSQKEAQYLEKYATTISLGKRILRCDTAVLSLLSLVSILSNN